MLTADSKLPTGHVTKKDTIGFVVLFYEWPKTREKNMQMKYRTDTEHQINRS